MQSSTSGKGSLTSARPSCISAPSVSEIIASKAIAATSPPIRKHFSGMVSRFSAGGQDMRSDPTDITAELDFTAAHGEGGEITVLRTLIHGIRIVQCEPIARAGSDIAMEKVVIVYEGITRAGASRSSQDITQQVRAHLQMYDFPGGYAQRFDGVNPGGAG